ncbi:MAG: hypothetical protein IKD38_01100 [Bacteroidaceae bacterium]|nr:hypothetical protein [Bacteroidaceae bacterium]
MNVFLRKISVAVLLLATVCAASARSWQINNNPNYKADFIGMNSAMASADVVDGDTLYLCAGCVINANQTISKRVTVIGTGWRYTDSPAAPAQIDGDVYITADGAKLLSLYVRGNALVRASNVTLERCFINTSIFHDDGNTVDNVKILSCWTGRIYGQKGRSTKWEIRNTYVDSYDTYAIEDLYNAVIENNFLQRNNGNSYLLYNCDYSMVKNNIMFCNGSQGKITFGCDNTVIAYNVLSLSPDYESNYPGNNVFINSMDRAVVIKNEGGAASAEYFQLIEGSPAIGAGEGGIDCGVLAGVYKFVPYGRPRNIPVIKKLVVPDSPTNGEINVTIGF